MVNNYTQWLMTSRKSIPNRLMTSDWVTIEITDGHHLLLQALPDPQHPGVACGQNVAWFTGMDFTVLVVNRTNHI